MKKNESPREPQIELGAFLQTQLKSERIRVLVLLLSVLAVFLLSTIRALALHAHEDRGHLLVKVVFLCFFVLYEVAMLRAVNRALRSGPVVFVGR